MTDYERHESHHMPHREPTPRWPSILMAVVALSTVIIGAVWGYAGISYASATIPAIAAKSEQNSKDIEGIKITLGYQDERDKEILTKLDKIEDKLDRLSDSKADKQVKGWTR